MRMYEVPFKTVIFHIYLSFSQGNQEKIGLHQI